MMDFYQLILKKWAIPLYSPLKPRHNKYKKLDDYDLKDFIDLYECVSNDMYKLMKDSYDRFRKKNEYQKLKKLIFTQ